MVENLSGRYVMWSVNPFNMLYQIWHEINSGAKFGVPHIVGTVKVDGSRIVEMEIEAVPHAREIKLIFAEENRIYFLIPIRVEEGIEGAYLRLIKALGVVG